MIRISLIQAPAAPVPPVPDDGTELTVIDLPSSEEPAPATKLALDAVHASRADAVILVLPGPGAGPGAGPEPAAMIEPLLRAAPVPSVLCCPDNLYAGPAPADRAVRAGALGRATAVLHGFGARTVELAVQAAVQLAHQQSDT